MAKKVDVWLNKSAVQSQLLKSPEITSICESYARGIASRCGSGYETSTQMGQLRVRVSVYAATKEARQDNLKNNTILRETHL